MSDECNKKHKKPCVCTPGDPCDYHAATCITCNPRPCKGHPEMKQEEHPCKKTLEALAAATATYNEKLKKFNEADRECALAYQAMSAALRQHNDAQEIYINKLMEERK